MKEQSVIIKRPYEAHKRLTTVIDGVSLTKGSHKDECDVNIILAKYQKTGLIEHAARTQGRYGDFSDVASYQEALNQVIAAQAAFEDLPSSMRKRFNNDPQALLDFLNDPENRDEAIRLGLIVPEPVEAPEEPTKKAAEPPQAPDEGA